MRYIVGIDEVGRGPLAGPLFIGAVAVPARYHASRITYHDGKPAKLKDSKKLTAKQREGWEVHLKKHPKVHYALASVTPKTIDRMNVARAANLAALRALRKLTTYYPLLTTHSTVYLDGGLYLGNGAVREEMRRLWHAKTIIKGDEKMNAIKMASILAKVARDRTMVRLAKQYPAYGFEVHKGYGTKRHMNALRRYGPSPAHRNSFLRRIST